MSHGKDDGNHLDLYGKVTFVGISSFTNDVCKTKICFQCAENLNDENISKEHIIPKWILRKFDLFNHSVTLPNGTPYKYKDYVTPCCKNCNGFLSRELEAPLSKTLGNGYDYFKEHIDESLLHRVFFWLATIFTKTHIKDQSLRMTLDRRGGASTIAESMQHDWESFHHTYTMNRALYTNAGYSSYCIGSIFVTRVDSVGAKKKFDYYDLSYAQTAGILIGDIGIIVVFGDAGAVWQELYEPLLSKLSDSVTSIQLRELIARFACCNLHIKNAPKFSTLSSSENPSFPTYISCSLSHPSPLFHEYNPKILGGLMDHLLGDLMEGKTDVENYRETLSKGELSFIFDSEYQVILPEDSFKPRKKHGDNF
tara:strand:+ start:621 stop:1721 length:1101 start_codon:yes stop_codon:yes gene_type:complete